jgi:hypothetical protein
MANQADWTFENYKYYLILNLAVGGNLGGTVDSTVLPQTLQVDYVRVYDSTGPSLSGAHIVEPNTAATYTVVDETGTGSSYAWTSPTGQTSSGKSLNVNWGTTGGAVSVTVTNSCGSYTRTLPVTVSPVLRQSVMLDDFEANRRLSYVNVSGALTQAVSNPAPDALNGSATVARYVRSAAAQYDLISAATDQIPDAAPYVRGEKAFYLDVYSAAPVGTPMLLQLENGSTATASNFPTGRHSRYIARTVTQNGWQRLKFLLDDRLDGGTADTAVNRMVLLLNPNSYTGDTYYLDNYAIHAR